MAANESPYMISYMSVIQMKSLSLIVFEIFAKIAFLTFDLGQGQRSWQQIPRLKVMAANDSHFYDFLYVYITNEVSISHCFRDICENCIFDLGPWTKVKGHGTKGKPI